LFPTDRDIDELEALLIPDDPAILARRRAEATAELDAVSADLARIQRQIDTTEAEIRGLQTRARPPEEEHAVVDREVGRQWQTETRRIQKEHQHLSGDIGRLASIAAQFHARFGEEDRASDQLAEDLVGRINRFLEDGNDRKRLQEELNALLKH
jgi:chromosome segregation ATPase